MDKKELYEPLTFFDEAESMRKTPYIETKAVKAGLVKLSGDHAFSSSVSVRQPM